MYNVHILKQVRKYTKCTCTCTSAPAEFFFNFPSYHFNTECNNLHVNVHVHAYGDVKFVQHQLGYNAVTCICDSKLKIKHLFNWKNNVSDQHLHVHVQCHVHVFDALLMCIHVCAHTSPSLIYRYINRLL